MLKLDDFQVVDKALKESAASMVKKYVISLVRNTELHRILKKKSFREAKTDLYNAHVGIDIMTCESNIVHQVLCKKADQFIKDRTEMSCLNKICSELPSIHEIASLNITDRMHIFLLTYMLKKDVLKNINVFNLEKDNMEMLFGKIINKCKRGLVGDKTVKPLLCSCFHRLLGSEGEYFYAIKIRKSNISKTNIVFLENSIIRSENTDKRVSAFVDFFARVLYDPEAEYEIVNKNLKVENKDAQMQIGIKDFVIKCSAFKCMHESHRIQNIVGVLNIVDEQGIIRETKIPAGYCAECNIFFVLESIYRDLSAKGIIMCRISDDMYSIKNDYFYGGKIAKESILMQYGYNVSKSNNLSSKSRHTILALIIDNNILSKSEIISYLDFFINQRVSMNNMKCAISKWREDREFVKKYKNDKYLQVGVASISK